MHVTRALNGPKVWSSCRKCLEGPRGKKLGVEVRPVRAGVIKLPTLSGASNLIFKCRVKISGSSFPPKKVPYVWVYMMSPQGSLGKISARWGFCFFQKTSRGLWDFAFCGGGGGGERRGGSFFYRWPNSASDAKQVILVDGIHSTKCL